MTQTEVPPQTHAAPAGSTSLFRHELRREGRMVAVLHGLRQADGSVVVETTVTPAGRDAGSALVRPFSFPSADHARRFADETLVALEYLGCDAVV